MDIKRAQFIKSAADYRDAPGELWPQIALMGRSNVGKSSLLNRLVGQNALAKVSGTPGKTRLINFFAIDGAWYLVDLPGYGYAAVSKGEQARWGRMLEEYLKIEERLVHGLLLVDIRHKPTELDRMMAAFLIARNLPFTVVATKCDKIAKSKRQKLLMDIAFVLRRDTLDEIIPFSSHTGEGKRELLARIGRALAEGGARN